MEVSEEKLYLYVLNEKNIYITKEHIESILKKYGVSHKVKNLKMFQQAMVHSSYIERDLKNDRITKIIKEKNLTPIDNPKLAIPLQPQSYERLEFLGDSIIHAVFADYLYSRYENENEGFMTRLRTKLENSETLSYLANKLDFHKYAIIARNIELSNGRDKNINIFEDCFEAFIGALFLESSFDLCQKFIIAMVQSEIDISYLLYNETNFKDVLLQYYHKMKWEDPEYGLEEASLPDEEGKKTFTMYVKGYMVRYDDESSTDSNIVWTKIAKGSGQTKKKGEQTAARNALLYYGVLNDLSDDEDEEYEIIK